MKFLKIKDVLFCRCFSILLCFFSGLISASLPPLLMDSAAAHRNFTAVSDFRLVNRRVLNECPDLSPYLKINVTSNLTLSDEENVTVTVAGVLTPSESDWVALISPSNSDVTTCPLSRAFYLQTGDISEVPLLCHYPVKAKFMKNDENYLNCSKKECQVYKDGECQVATCSGSITFHVINIRTDIEFVFFSGGLDKPCILTRTVSPLKFANRNQPLYGHLSSIDSTATSMRLTWISGDNKPQQVMYGNGKSQISNVTTFSQENMCSSPLPSPAKDYGWHDPGFIHSAVMTGLQPSTTFSYKYGSDSVGWSDEIQFKTPPNGGSNEVKFIAYGDMGKAPLDASVEHYIQPGSLSVINAIIEEVNSSSIDSIFHIGDISYATGFLVEWDYFLHLIHPLASRVPYMTAIGNHERDYISSGSVYITPDSGGECGVAYETYFQMPTSGKDKPWYSIEQASVHFTVISTEHDWSKGSEQYEWMKNDMASVNRSRTPWLIFTGHRPMYASTFIGGVDFVFVQTIEPLLLKYKVDVALFGHIHNYERTCSVHKKQCKSMPTKDENGVYTYNNNNYIAPIHVVIGMAGFRLDNFPDNVEKWSLSRISNFGYVRGHATKEEIKFEFVNSNTRTVEDSFRVIKNQSS